MTFAVTANTSSGFEITLGGGDHVALPDVRALVITEQTPTAERSYTITAPYVELRLVTLRGLHLQGFAPTIEVTVGGDITRAPAVRALVITEQTPTAERSYTIEPAVRALVIT